MSLKNSNLFLIKNKIISFILHQEKISLHVFHLFFKRVHCILFNFTSTKLISKRKKTSKLSTERSKFPTGDDLQSSHSSLFRTLSQHLTTLNTDRFVLSASPCNSEVGGGRQATSSISVALQAQGLKHGDDNVSRTFRGNFRVNHMTPSLLNVCSQDGVTLPLAMCSCFSPLFI